MDSLKALGFRDLSYLMHPGIYVLCLNGEVVYVGQTIDLFNRISKHQHGDHRFFDKIYFVRCDVGEMDRLEALMILKLKPKNGNAFNFNNNTDVRNKPPAHSSGQAVHTISVRGVELSVRGWRRL